MERQKMKKRGFTLVELLVVIAIIAMLLAILMPALGKVRQLAQRIMCSTNLSGLGKAMLTYSNDDKYESFPIAGSAGAKWDRGSGTVGPSGTGRAGTCSWDWRMSVFVEGSGTPTSPPRATLSSCLYLLTRLADTTPDQFICPGSDNKKFQLSNFDFTAGGLDPAYKNASFSDVWDFGSALRVKTGFSMGKGHNTYSYQLPLPIETSHTIYPITTTTNPAKPVLADRNPFFAFGNNPFLYTWDSAKIKPFDESLPKGNTTYHQKDGQNVLYADIHAKFEKSANCGIQQDNIYTCWNALTIPTTEEDRRQCGTSTAGTRAGTTGSAEVPIGTDVLTIAGYRPQHDEDSYLVSDIDNYPAP